MVNIEYFKKRWLFFLGCFFIYLVPLALIIWKTFTLKEATERVAISAVGVIVGVVYIAFVYKKLKAKIASLQPSFSKYFLTTLANTVPFATLGLLAIIVKASAENMEYLIWTICASMLFGGLLQGLDFVHNKAYLYDLELNKKAKEQIDLAAKIKELEDAKAKQSTP